MQKVRWFWIRSLPKRVKKIHKMLVWLYQESSKRKEKAKKECKSNSSGLLNHLVKPKWPSPIYNGLYVVESFGKGQMNAISFGKSIFQNLVSTSVSLFSMGPTSTSGNWPFKRNIEELAFLEMENHCLNSVHRKLSMLYLLIQKKVNKLVCYTVAFE